jgi:uncharacterized protein (DUF362 family)
MGQRLGADRPEVVDTREATAVDRLGAGLAAFLAVHPGATNVLIKTSTAGRRSPDHEVSADLLATVLAVVVEVCGGGRIVLGDGPASDVPYEGECRRLGWEALAHRFGARIQDLNHDVSTEIEGDWPVSQTFLAADVVINLTKAKTHRRFGVSLTEKSLLGALSASRLGYPKLANRHSYVPWLLTRILQVAPPIFSIIDGVNGIEGQGPLNGTPTASHFLCFGVGCVAPDVRGVVEMGFDPALVPGFHRPLPGSGAGRQSRRWSDLRVTDFDFQPPDSCPWLLRSLDRSWGRTGKFRSLQRGARRCWPVPAPAGSGHAAGG